MTCFEKLRNNVNTVICGIIIALVLVLIIAIALFFVLGPGGDCSSEPANNTASSSSTPASSAPSNSRFDANKGDKPIPPAPNMGELKSEGFEEYQINALNTHNMLRAKHKSPPLKLSKKLCALAMKCCEYYAHQLKNIDHSCPFKQIDEPGYTEMKYGENLHMDGGALMKSANRVWHKDGDGNLFSQQGIWDYYNEIQWYDYANPAVMESAKPVGHFTQLVWKGSKEYGQAAIVEDGNGAYVCDLYFPPGNEMDYNGPDKYKLVKENVVPPSA